MSTMNPHRFSLFLTDLASWSTNPPPCADPQNLDDPAPEAIAEDMPGSDVAPRGAITSARRAALTTKLKKRIAEANNEGDWDRDIAEAVPILDEDDDTFLPESDPVRF